MSVDGGKITLRFEVDITQLNQQLQQAGYSIDKVKQQIEGGTTTMTKFSGAATEAGQKATTAAVRFQTLAQGAINLTTSFTQAYTSISNLSRAKTSLQAAALGVERAEDSLARTQYNLNKAMNASTKDYERIHLLQERGKTNADALSVAQMRLKDETDRVKDTYVLFALNIANVGFSAIQTIKVMKDMIPLMKESNAVLAITNALTSKWVLIAVVVIASYEVIIRSLQAANIEWAKGASIMENVTKLWNDFDHAQDITLKHTRENLEDDTAALNDWSNAEKSALEASNLRYRKWAIERFKIRYEDVQQQKTVNYLTGNVGASQGNFQ